MRSAHHDRMKRRVLQEAVAENLDTIRGLPPRAARPAQRALRLWGRRAPLLLVPMLLAGSTYMMTNAAAPPHAAPVGATQAMVQRPMFLAAETTPVVERMTATAFPLAVKRVVLDAGHGGSDPGATAEQLLEKEITLDIGRRLRQKLERDGFEVVVTREADRTVALRDRAKLANDSRSDIFVSIHVNALLAHTNARGIETYYLGATSDPKLTQLAAAENRVSGYSIADMRALLDGVYAGARRDESHALAGAVQHQLFTTLRKADPGLENWGVKRAPFLVLVATDMPAVLAEVGCISNEKEAAMLRRPEYRQQIADALFAGIRGYAKKGSENHG